MGDLNGYSVNTVNSGSPDWTHSISYYQSARSGTSATYRFTVSMTLTEGSYGYGSYAKARVTVNGATSGWATFGGSNSWSLNTTRSVTIDVTASAGAGGGNLSASVEWDSGTTSASSPNSSASGTVTLSTWNTNPGLSGSVTVSPSGTVPENTTSVAVSWPAGTDNETTSGMTYTLQRELDNNGSWANVITTSSTSYTHAISLTQGQLLRYRVWATDNYGATSGYIYSSFITCNTFTKATLNTNNSIGFSTTSLAFTATGAANTNGNGTFTYSISCPGLTGLGTVTPDASGNFTVPITRSQVQALIGSSVNYVGTLTFTLTTTNAYGSSGTSTKAVTVDLRIAPTAISSVTIPTSCGYAIGGTTYYIPNRKAIVVNWTASTDQLGGAIKYDVAVSIDGGAYSNVITDTTLLTGSFNLTAVSKTCNLDVRVTAKTTFTYTATKNATQIKIDYYNPPTIAYDPVNRLQTSAIVSGKIVSNTSVTTGLTINTPTYVYNGGSSTNTTWTAATKVFTSTLSSLTDVSTGPYTLTVSDTAGAALGLAATVLTITVTAYIPMFAARSNGVGVNALPDGINKLIVGGDVLLTSTTPWLTLDSPSAGGDPSESAGISIGESGKKGGAALHLTYTGNGYSHIGMGAVDANTSLPAYEAIRLFYTSPDTLLLGNLTVGQSTDVTTHCILVQSQADAFISIYADTDNVNEDDNAYIRLAQDANTVVGLIGLVGGAGYSPENNVYTGTDGNSLLISATSTYPVHIGTNSRVTLSVYDQMVSVIGGLHLVSSSGIGATASDWLGFYDSGGTRKGWIGDGSTSNSDIGLTAEAGYLNLTGSSGVAMYGVLNFPSSTDFDFIKTLGIPVLRQDGGSTIHLLPWGKGANGNNTFDTVTIGAGGGIANFICNGNITANGGVTSAGNFQGNAYGKFNNGMLCISGNEQTTHAGIGNADAYFNYRNGNGHIGTYRMQDGSGNYTSVTATAYNNSSTKEFKTNIVEYDQALAYEAIKSIKPRMYSHTMSNDIKLGIIAEEAPLEIMDFYEEWYGYEFDENDPDEVLKRDLSKPGRAIDVYSWTTLISAALKETQCRLEDAQETIQDLQNRIIILEGRAV